jgi:ATP-dependent DNA helicase RecG
VLAAPISARPATVAALAELDLCVIGDLLEALPFRFDDFSKVVAFRSLHGGEDATVLVSVESIGERRTSRRNLRIIHAAVTDHDGTRARVTWFNQRYLLRTLEPGMLLLVRGEARTGSHGLEISARTHEIVATAEEAERGEAVLLGLAPVYRASSKVSSRLLRDITGEALRRVARVGDPVPTGIRLARRLPLRRDAIVAGHRPRTLGEAEVARRRLAYEELLLLQVALLRHRRALDAAATAIALPPPGALVARYRAGLPFPLTGAQERAIGEIGRDLERATPMQRLLQGDVGSGKTAVALAVLLRAIENAHQAALMAPTEVLAVQHLASAERLLDGTGVEVCLLTGDVPKREADARRQRIASGEPLLAIGTHALLHVPFGSLAVAVVDEQHRFGVDQRGGLQAGGASAHVLHMTATPIPRSLALTLYGDLDVTVLDELPAGRLPVKTRVISETKREDCYAWLVGQAGEGRQAYVVCALVEGSELIEARAAEEEAERLASGPLQALTVACVHGQMRSAEKAEAMRRFVAGDVDVLVATTVIEVGVDVPNASIMVIEDADRFGLSQLHQLRGRVGRGAEQAYCFLFESAEPTEDGAARLKALVDHASGFELAEIDLDMRGEGHLLGQLQSGRSAFRHARLSRDRVLLEHAREDARSLLDADDAVLEQEADDRYGDLIAGMRRG